MVDWLVVWGATKGLGVLVTPFLQDLAKDGAKDLAVGFFKDTLTHQFREKDPRQVGTVQAIKVLLQRIQKELKFRHKFSDSDIQHCVQDVKKFLAQKQVQEFLGKPFDLSCDSLDSNTLKKYWENLNLVCLPPNFNWSGVTEEYFLEVKTILDDPESKDLRDILQSQKLADIDKATQDIRKNTQEIAGIIPEFDLITYQEAILETYEKLKLDSLDTSGYAYNEIKLWRIFTEQNLRAVHQYLPRVYELPKEHFQKLKSSDQIEARDFNEEEIDNLKRGYLEQPITPVLEIVRQKSTYKYTVILGDPGSGKSTLLQHLAVTWAKLSPQEAAKQDIPLLIELRTYVRKRENQECKNFLDFFHNCSGVIHHLNQHQLHEELKAGRGLVMFDGLDEIFDPGIRLDIITDIHRFTNTYPDVQVIVTSRVIGYKADKLKNAGFSHFMLQDLSAAQIQDFIQRWHNLTYDNQEEKQRKSERLSRGIHNSSAIQELAGNPLLLTMMAILNRNQELPRDRAELYNQASRVLLHQWDVERFLIEDKRIDPKTIDYKDKQSMLREVAYKMQTSAKGLAGNLNDPCVREDDFQDNPREAALKAITQLYPIHPQTLPLLRDRAKNDPGKKVREFAQKAIRTIENTNQNLT